MKATDLIKQIKKAKSVYMYTSVFKYYAKVSKKEALDILSQFDPLTEFCQNKNNWMMEVDSEGDLYI